MLPEHAPLLVGLFQEANDAAFAEVLPGGPAAGLDQVVGIQQGELHREQFGAPQGLVDPAAVAAGDGQPKDLAGQEGAAFGVEIPEDLQETMDQAVGDEPHVLEAELLDQFAFEHVVQGFLGQRPVAELDVLAFVEGVHR